MRCFGKIFSTHCGFFGARASALQGSTRLAARASALQGLRLAVAFSVFALGRSRVECSVRDWKVIRFRSYHTRLVVRALRSKVRPCHSNLFRHLSSNSTAMSDQSGSRSISNDEPPSKEITVNLGELSELLATSLATVMSRQQQTEQTQTSCVSDSLEVADQSLASGLVMRRVARSDTQQRDAGVLSKHRRGSTAAARLKVKEKMVVELTNKLTVNNITSVLNGDSSKDIAEESRQYQIALCELREKLRQADLEAIFHIPETFDVDDPSTAKGPFINLLTDYSKVSLEIVLRWQRFVNRNASDVELESNNWAEEILQLSMDSELTALVFDDIEGIENSRARGAITTFKLMTNRVVLNIQEKVDAYHNWIRKWTILTVDGQNVVIGVSRWKAVLRALGNDNLPTNTLRYLLSGFQQASHEEFAQLCATLNTMHSTDLVPKNPDLTETQTCFQVLEVLERVYHELSAATNWAYSKYDGAAFRVAQSPAKVAAKQDSNSPQGKQCFGCSELGHRLADCPNDSSRSKRKGGSRRKGGNTGCHKGGRNERDNRRFKRTHKALENIAAEGSSDSDSGSCRG